MNIGMLWFDNDAKADLATKVERAATYYQQKYGKFPTICFVHPSMAPAPPVKEDGDGTAESPEEEEAIKAGDIEVRTNRSVLPNHLWIGVNGVNGQATQ